MVFLELRHILKTFFLKLNYWKRSNDLSKMFIYQCMTKQFILDIDECADAMNNATHKSSLCYNNGSCMNTLGSYTCNCTLGWEGLKCETGKLFCLNLQLPVEIMLTNILYTLTIVIFGLTFICYRCKRVYGDPSDKWRMYQYSRVFSVFMQRRLDRRTLWDRYNRNFMLSNVYNLKV